LPASWLQIDKKQAARFARTTENVTQKRTTIMPKTTETPNVSMANTKKEMLDAYQIVKHQLKDREKQVLDAEKARKQMEMMAAEATADAQASQDPLQRLYSLKSDFSRELTSLAESFENEIDEYRKIKSALKAKQEELQTLYEIETTASDLAALIEAQQIKKAEFAQEMEMRRQVFEEERQTARTKWDGEIKEHHRIVKEQAEDNKKQRQREREEYEYVFEREKEQRKNALEDELRALENEIAQNRKDFEQEMNQRNMEVTAREKSVAEQEDELARLRKEVDSFPERLKSEVQAADAATTKGLTRDFDQSRALLEAQFEGQKNVLASKIESLEKLVSSQEAQMAQLSKRQEQAYEKVQDIANRAVAAAKREVISIPVGSSSSSDQDEKNKN